MKLSHFVVFAVTLLVGYYIGAHWPSMVPYLGAKSGS